MYRVSWEIDLAGLNNPKGIAESAWRIMRRDDSTANVFTVTDVDTGETWKVDLHEGTVESVAIPSNSPASYADELRVLIDAFDYELCTDCSQDIDQHTIAPDMFGKPHAWCASAIDPTGTATRKVPTGESDYCCEGHPRGH